jgi:hypothetical protein
VNHGPNKAPYTRPLEPLQINLFGEICIPKNSRAGNFPQQRYHITPASRAHSHSLELNRPYQTSVELTWTHGKLLDLNLDPPYLTRDTPHGPKKKPHLTSFNWIAAHIKQPRGTWMYGKKWFPGFGEACLKANSRPPTLTYYTFGAEDMHISIIYLYTYT